MATTVLYFAYGSNLDEGQMRVRCPRVEVGARARLEGYALVFGGHSRRWGGGVASVMRASDACVDGRLYLLCDEDLGRLDRFEGHPLAYHRVERPVIDEAGNACRAHVYVKPAKQFVAAAPSRAYLELLERAYAQLGFDPAALARAATTRLPP